MAIATPTDPHPVTNLDVAAVVGAAHHAEWRGVEIDQCADDVVHVLAASCRYLESFDLGRPI